MRVDHATKKMVGGWRDQGRTEEEIGLELDSRICFCGMQTCKGYLKSPETFTLTDFGYMSLKWTYAILAKHKHVPKWQTVDFPSHELEWKRWRITAAGLRKSELVMCVIALEKLVEIVLSGEPFIVAQKQKPNGSTETNV